MSLKKRGEVWHYDFTVDGVRHRGSTQLRSKAAAREIEDRERRRAAMGQIRPVSTLQQVAVRWFAQRIEGRKSVTTVALRVKILFRHIDPALPCNEIGPREIEDAIISRRHETIRQSRKGEPRAPANATVNRDLIDTTLRPMLRYAAKTMEEPVRDIEWKELRLPEPKGRDRSFSPAEVLAWNGAFPEWHRPLFVFIMRYGLRLAEAFFPLEGFNAEAGVVTVRDRKNGKTHIVMLTPGDAREMAARYGRAKEAGLKTVWFRDLGDGLEPITRRGFQSASRRALDRASIANARAVHDMRHHAATAFLRLPGATLKHVQKLLGHENIASTARYAHVEAEDVREIMGRNETATDCAVDVPQTSDNPGQVRSNQNI